MVQLTVRLPDALHTKIKVIAAYDDSSINNIVVEALENKVALWEKEYGKLLMPGEKNG